MLLVEIVEPLTRIWVESGRVDSSRIMEDINPVNIA